jgi:6-pyruvoyltetrahydropterin/6-carboxytetrahydropterin synthase
LSFRVVLNSSSIKFSACHFLKEPSQCSRLHGHNYYVSVEISHSLDENHFVVDFLELKEELASIVEPMDHYILIPTDSKDLQIKEDKESVEIITSNKRYIFPRDDILFLPLSATTSELMAKYIHSKLKEIYPDKKILIKVRESRSTMATYEE